MQELLDMIKIGWNVVGNIVIPANPIQLRQLGRAMWQVNANNISVDANIRVAKIRDTDEYVQVPYWTYQIGGETRYVYRRETRAIAGDKFQLLYNNRGEAFWSSYHTVDPKWATGETGYTWMTAITTGNGDIRMSRASQMPMCHSNYGKQAYIGLKPSDDTWVNPMHWVSKDAFIVALARGADIGIRTPKGSISRTEIKDILVEFAQDESTRIPVIA